MQKEIFKGKWHEIKGKIKMEFGKLTDNDLQQLEGKQEHIYGLLEKHYGYSKEEARKKIDEFNKNLYRKEDRRAA